jgi:hypothetical protein
MSYFIFGLVCAALCHFVYESILAPSLRLELRFELFKLRDEVRFLKMNNLSSSAASEPEFVDEHYGYLQDSINALLSVLYRYDIAAIWTITDRINRDEALRQRVEARARLLDACELPAVRSLRQRQLDIAARALAVNSGPMLLLLLAPTLVLRGYKAVRGKIRGEIRTSLTVPGTDLKRCIPREGDVSAGLVA